MSAGGYFTYAGRSSRTFGILVDRVEGIWDSPERDFEDIEIPGRNGDLTIDNGRWRNVPGSYYCGIGVDFKQNFETFRAFFASCVSYARLEDSWHPDEYRLAKPAGALSPEMVKNGLLGEFAVPFSVMPQRFLKSGETAQNITSTSTLTNPTLFEALPLLRVYGTGTFSIGGVQMKITSANSYTDIDCDARECYKDTYATNCNDKVELTSGKFPTLPAGISQITLGSGITRISITPRWWTL